MGKRTGQLAGLAALGALGYMLSRDKKGESSTSETRSSAPSAAPSAAQVSVKEEEDNYPDESRRGRMASPPQSIPNTVVAAPVASKAPVRAAPAAAPAAARAAAPAAASETPAVSDTYPDESRRGRMASAPESDDVPGAAAAVARFKKETAGMPPAIAQGRAPMTKRQPVVNTYTRKMGATASEIEAYRAAQAARAGKDNRPDLSTPEGRKRAEQAQALERVYPEQAVIAPGVKGVAALAKGLANRSPRLSEMTQEALAAPVRRLPAPTYLLRKKGGTVKKMASGGMTVSKASSRADGIAQRGKTRGKLY